MKRKLLLEEQKRLHPQTSHDTSNMSHDHSSDTNENSSSQPQLLTLPQIERKERNYRPIEFPGTLGKVAPSSISAPRKTIDVPLSGGSGGGVEGAKDTYTKKKQTLAVIEKVCEHVYTTTNFRNHSPSHVRIYQEFIFELRFCIKFVYSWSFAAFT